MVFQNSKEIGISIKIFENMVISPITKIRPPPLTPLATLPDNFISTIDRGPFETQTYEVSAKVTQQFFL